MTFQTFTYALILGSLATAVMDVVAFLRRWIQNVPSLDYALVGRWIGHMGRGTFTHEGIGKSEPISGEKPLGWTAHYGVGMIFAVGLVWITGAEPQDPAGLIACLACGAVTVVMPFFVMQPAFGLGFGAARTPAPWVARQRSLIAHLSFGVGLWLAGLALSVI